MNEFRADLHCHSICSDGSLSPEELIRLAKEKGLSGLSITDHDSVEAYPIAIPLCKDLDISLLTGIEFSTEMDGFSIHILGYGFNADDPHIANFCLRHKARRIARNKAILDLLTKNGMPLSETELIAANPMKNNHSVFGRPHIGLAMVQKGYVNSVQQAFKIFLSEDRPCYARGDPFSVAETINIIHQAKGLAVIAHPHLLHNNKILSVLLEMDFDGIECFYGNFPSKNHKRWLKIAKKKNWLITGGSDFHGSIKPNIDLGCSWIDETLFETIQNYLKQKS